MRRHALPSSVVHAPCPVHACVHASGMLRACSVLRAPSVGTYGILWEVMGIFCVFLRCKAFFHNVFYTAGRFFVVYFVLQGVFSQRFFRYRSCLHCVFSLQVVFSQRFFAICRIVFTLRVFAASRFFTTFFTLQRFSLCILCCVAFSRHVSIHFVLSRFCVSLHFLSHSLHFLSHGLHFLSHGLHFLCQCIHFLSHNMCLFVECMSQRLLICYYYTCWYYLLGVVHFDFMS